MTVPWTENVSFGISSTPLHMATVVSLSSYTRITAGGRWREQQRAYLEFKNGKPLGKAAYTITANCLWTPPDSPVKEVLGQQFSSNNDKGELGINVIVRLDKC